MSRDLTLNAIEKGIAPIQGKGGNGDKHLVQHCCQRNDHRATRRSVGQTSAQCVSSFDESLSILTDDACEDRSWTGPSAKKSRKNNKLNY